MAKLLRKQSKLTFLGSQGNKGANSKWVKMLVLKRCSKGTSTCKAGTHSETWPACDWGMLVTREESSQFVAFKHIITDGAQAGCKVLFRIIGLGESSPGAGWGFLLFCSVAKSCLALFDHMDCSSPGSSVPHYLLEFLQIYALSQ